MLEHVLQGAELDAAEEASALDWLLGAPKPVPYDMTVQVETGNGLAPLTFVFLAPDGRKIDEIEERHRSQATGMIDRIAADCELVAAVTQFVEDGRDKRQIQLKSEEFRTVKQRGVSGELEDLVLASPAEALERKFRTQLGLVQGVAREVRRVGGWDPERQGQAQRRLVSASLD